ncbi:Ninja-family protein AFP3 [Camellia lanceoleosa]|uniref:Ninja-family protein AFP3 n=1 Tax=Camellia lanceoleosa TaxID=1840588 RepID=A0ACC0HSP6_9ERIC|nr:Ninja-family protein AFP3 [Camellia lanceoleosa]
MEYAPLIRTCSLPTETEEEWRKRKEIQSMRRVEAKTKRLKKMKTVRTTVRDQVGIMISGVEANGEEENAVVSQGPVAVKGSTRDGGADGSPR